MAKNWQDGIKLTEKGVKKSVKTAKRKMMTEMAEGSAAGQASANEAAAAASEGGMRDAETARGADFAEGMGRINARNREYMNTIPYGAHLADNATRERITAMKIAAEERAAAAASSGGGGGGSYRYNSTGNDSTGGNRGFNSLGLDYDYDRSYAYQPKDTSVSWVKDPGAESYLDQAYAMRGNSGFLGSRGDSGGRSGQGLQKGEVNPDGTNQVTKKWVPNNSNAAIAARAFATKVDMKDWAKDRGADNPTGPSQEFANAYLESWGNMNDASVPRSEAISKFHEDFTESVESNEAGPAAQYKDWIFAQIFGPEGFYESEYRAEDTDTDFRGTDFNFAMPSSARVPVAGVAQNVSPAGLAMSQYAPPTTWLGSAKADQYYQAMQAMSDIDPRSWSGNPWDDNQDVHANSQRAAAGQLPRDSTPFIPIF